MLGCNLTLKQRTNGLLMVRLSCHSAACSRCLPWTIIHLTLPWARPQSKTGTRNNSMCTENRIFWQFALSLEFPQMLCFYSWWFFGFEICASVFGTMHWMWSCPHSSSQQKPRELQQEQACFMAYGLEILYSVQRGFPKLDVIDSITAVFC